MPVVPPGWSKYSKAHALSRLTSSLFHASLRTLAAAPIVLEEVVPGPNRYVCE